MYDVYNIFQDRSLTTRTCCKISMGRLELPNHTSLKYRLNHLGYIPINRWGKIWTLTLRFWRASSCQLDYPPIFFYKVCDIRPTGWWDMPMPMSYPSVGGSQHETHTQNSWCWSRTSKTYSREVYLNHSILLYRWANQAHFHMLTFSSAVYKWDMWICIDVLNH